MGAGPETKYINEVANIFINEKRALHYAEIVKKKKKEKEFFKSYSE